MTEPYPLQRSWWQVLKNMLILNKVMSLFAYLLPGDRSLRGVGRQQMAAECQAEGRVQTKDRGRIANDPVSTRNMGREYTQWLKDMNEQLDR
jgi:hypothetical protein